MTTAQRLMRWASDIHLARQVVEDLRKQMADLHCQYELACDFVELGPGEPLRDRYGLHYQLAIEDREPCWKGHWELVDNVGGSEYVSTGDSRDSGWCDPCKAREKLRTPCAEANRRLSSLKGALWRLAAKAHAEVEAELDGANHEF